MIEVLQYVATLAAATFAGAALYINIVEHPARLSLSTEAALAQWAPSYHRATLMQAPLAIVGFLSGVGVWLLGGHSLWLVASLLLGAVVPFTFIVIMPTNNKLLAMRRGTESSETRKLLAKWGSLHGVRTALSVAATVMMLWGLRGS